MLRPFCVPFWMRPMSSCLPVLMKISQLNCCCQRNRIHIHLQTKMEEKKNSVWVDVICIDSTIPIFENIFNYLFVASALTDTTHVEPSTLRCDVIKLLTKNTSVSIVLKWGYFWNDATIPYETLFVLRINFANCKRSVFAQQLAIARSMILLRTFYLDPPIDRLVHCKCMLRTDYDRIKFVFHWKKNSRINEQRPFYSHFL